MQKITPFLWFNENAEEAVRFYTAIFKNSKIKDVARHGEAGAKISGTKKSRESHAILIENDQAGYNKAAESL